MPDYSSQIEKLSKELNRFIKNPTYYPDDEIEVNVQEFDGKQIVNVKILDRVLN